MGFGHVQGYVSHAAAVLQPLYSACYVNMQLDGLYLRHTTAQMMKPMHGSAEAARAVINEDEG